MVHWGSDRGFYQATPLRTICAIAVVAADFDGDGHLDLAFANELGWKDGVDHGIEPFSYVYWGDGSRAFDEEERAEIPSVSPSALSAADIDGDGALDLVFSQTRFRESETDFHSDIHWGGGGDRSFDGPTRLEALDTKGVSVADLDGDALLDIVLTNRCWDHDFACDSAIYWGTGARTGWGVTSPLPTLGARGSRVADLNEDGILDVVVFNNRSAYATLEVFSTIYFGPPPFGPSGSARLLGVGASSSHTLDLGNVYDRSPTESFVSGELVVEGEAAELRFAATTPLDTAVRFQLRSATTTAGVVAAPWLGPTSADDWYETSGTAVNAAHRGHHHFQYRAELDLGTDRGVVVLDRVVIAAAR